MRSAARLSVRLFIRPKPRHHFMVKDFRYRPEICWYDNTVPWSRLLLKWSFFAHSTLKFSTMGTAVAIQKLEIWPYTNLGFHWNCVFLMSASRGCCHSQNVLHFILAAMALSPVASFGLLVLSLPASVCMCPCVCASVRQPRDCLRDN